MVPESELVGRLREVLGGSDLNTATAASIRRTLEEYFGIDLSDRKVFVREQIHLFLESQWGEHQNDGADEQDAQEKSENGQQKGRDGDESGEEDTVEENAEEEKEEDEEESGRKRNKKDGRPDTMDKALEKKARGFSKPCSLSPQLQKFVGVPELARTEVVKKIWAYIREKNLQNPKN